MMTESSTEKISKQVQRGFAWSLLENISLQGIRFLIGIIMARLLSPSDYGMVGMLTVIIVISDLLINGGIGSALNKKQDRTEKDFYTVFIFNVSVGLLLYAILYFLAPYVAAFYNIPLLEKLTKVLTVSLVINAMSIIPMLKLQIALNFKSISIITVISSLLSGLSGFLLAVNGFGVWALVYSTIIGNVVRLFLLFGTVRWMPRLQFSLQSFRSMYTYGSKLMFAVLMDNIYSNMYPLLIGKFFSASALGYYSRAQGYASIPSSTITMMIYRVCFPAFCKQAVNREALFLSYEKMMRNVAFISFLLMTLLLSLAHPLVAIIISEKWMPCVNMLKILCLAVLWSPVLEVNLSMIKAMGQSSAILKMQILNKSFAIAVLLVTFHFFNIIVMCWGAVFISLFSVFVNFRLSASLLKISVRKQFSYLYISFVGAIVMYLVIACVIYILDNNFLQCLVGGVLGIVAYLTVTAVLGFPTMEYIKKINNHLSKMLTTKDAHKNLL